MKRLYAGRKDLAWGLQRLAEHEHDIMNAGELLRLSERTLVAPLDPYARTIVAASAKRVSVVTAVSPGALIDMLFVGAENLRMLRRLATLYGARPGTLSLLKLARMVVTHIVLTGGIALGDDVIQQVIGHGLTAKLSARLGEGIFNGALTTRIGIAAIDVCRPLPYIESQRPRFRELVAEVAGVRCKLAHQPAAIDGDLLRLAVLEFQRDGDLVGASEAAGADAEAGLSPRSTLATAA